jgi:hypothetical protein
MIHGATLGWRWATNLRAERRHQPPIMWHVEYKTSGSFALKMNNGFSDAGDWKAEDGKICSKGRKIGSSCNEVRTKGDAIYLKRGSGEIVQFVVQP